MVLQIRHILSVHTTSCIVGLVVQVRHGASHILYCSFDRLDQIYFMRAYHIMYCWFGLFQSDIYYACIPHQVIIIFFFLVVEVRHTFLLLTSCIAGLVCSGQTWCFPHSVLLAWSFRSDMVLPTSGIVGLVVQVRHGASHILYCWFGRSGQTRCFPHPVLWFGRLGQTYMSASHILYCWFDRSGQTQIICLLPTSYIVGLVVQVRHGSSHILYCWLGHIMYCRFGLFRSDIIYMRASHIPVVLPPRPLPPSPLLMST